MHGYAIQRSVRQSPRKMRLVIDLIRGKNVNEAYAILQFNKKLADAQVDMGTPLKRHHAAAQGRATPIIKRTSHVKIAVAEKPAKKKKGAK
jgi:large subunit ribosomal protein L22